MKAAKDLALLAVPLLLVVLASLSLWGGEHSSMQEDIFPARTTYSSRPGGMRALYLTLSDLGYPVRRERTDFSRLPQGAVLFLIEPSQSVRNDEWAHLRDWVNDGGLAFCFLEWELAPSAADWIGPDEPLELPPEFDSTPIQPSFAASGGASLRVCSRVRLALSQAVEKAAAEPPFNLPSIVRPDSGGFESFDAGAVPLYADEMGITLSYCHLGKGAIILCASPWSVSNEGLGRSQAIQLVLNVLRVFAPDKQRAILFDEYHHGYGETKPLLSLLPPLAKGALIQIAVALALLLFSLGKRFGAPVPVAEQKRARGEYLAAMSLLLRRAGATDLVAQRLREKFRRDLARARGLSTAAREDEVARAAEAVGVSQEQVRGLFSACAQVEESRALKRERAGKRFSPGVRRGEEGRLLRIAREMREVVARCQRIR